MYVLYIDTSYKTYQNWNLQYGKTFFGKAYLARHYYKLSLSDQCPGVEKNI